MANTELRRRLQDLAQQFVDGVLASIRAVPLSDVAAEIGGSAGRALAAAPARGAGRGQRGAARAARGRAAASETGRRRPRKLVRRPTDEIQRIRQGILRVLSKASNPIGAAEIAREIGNVETAALAFPMSKLRNSGLVNKQGERTQAVYSLTDKGRSTLSGEGGAAAGGKRSGGAKAAAKKPNKRAK